MHLSKHADLFILHHLMNDNASTTKVSSHHGVAIFTYIHRFIWKTYSRECIDTLSTLSWLLPLLHISQYNTWQFYGMLTTWLNNKDLKMQLVSLQVPTMWASDTETVSLGDIKSFARLRLSVSCRLNVPQICIILTGTHFCLKPYCLKPQFSPDNHGIKTDTKSTCGWQMIQ